MSDKLNARNLETALTLARAGAFIFPCQGRGPTRKQPCKGVYWRSVSTRDETRIKYWWKQFPEAVPGIDLAKTELFVVDCDCKPSNGLEWLAEYAGKHGDDLSIPAVDTPSGGRHLYYLNTFDPPHGNGRGNLPPKEECGIDIRGHGGFVVAPGSIFADGGEYIAHSSIFDAGPPPVWLVDLLSKSDEVPAERSPIIAVVPAGNGDLAAYGAAALHEEQERVAYAPEGERNNTLNAASHSLGQLVPHILARGDVERAMEEAALAAGLSIKEARATVRSALKAGMKKPRGPSEPPAVLIDLPAARCVIEAQDGTLADAETGEIIESPSQVSEELPDHLTRVPGLVGEITDWITDTAMFPQRGLSLGAALTIVGTAAGRHLAGPNRCGTHLYVIGLAPSGAGKNHPLTMISTIMDAAGLRQHVGPSQFISMPAVINFLTKTPLSVCPMDEFGSFLKRINSRRASGFEGAISGMLRSAWGASFAIMPTPEWASKSRELICAPAMSIFGVSTTREFYESLEGADVTNGVLNRFLLIETKTRPLEHQPVADSGEVPSIIVAGLKAIYNRHPMPMQCQSSAMPAFETLAMTPDAELIRSEFVAELRAKGDAYPGMEAFLARTAENAVRLATIVTIGKNSMKINAQTMEWARNLAAWSSHVMAEGAGLYIADSDTQAIANSIRRAIKERGGRIRRRDLIRALDHKYKTRDVDESIKGLSEAEQIFTEKVMAGPSGGRPSYFYRLVDN